MLSILTWNILHGGGPKRTPAIILTLLDRAPDIIALCEVRSTFGGQIAAVLADHGWHHQARTFTRGGGNGILLASREPIESGAPAPASVDPRRWLDVHVSSVDWRLTAIHAPHASTGNHAELSRRAAYFRGLIEHAKGLAGKGHVIMGDANIGRHRIDETGASFTCTALLGELLTAGYTDAWKTQNPLQKQGSWRSSIGNDRRIDHAFVSHSLEGQIKAATYLQEARELGLSDHSPLEIQMERGPGREFSRKK